MRRILLVGSDRRMSGALAAAVGGPRRGIVVDHAKTLFEALCRARARRPDIVLVDVSTRGAGARTFTRRLHQHDPACRVLWIAAVAELGHSRSGCAASEPAR
jgi:DNA-binding NarL/FixJ family response regulator